MSYAVSRDLGARNWPLFIRIIPHIVSFGAAAILSFPIGRFLWIVVVIGCFVAATTQIGMQVVYLMKDEDLANIKVVYEDMLPFPAITICNQNQFRYIRGRGREEFRYLESYRAF